MSMEPPLSTKAGLDVTEFKAGMAEINRSFRVLNSEFKASAAAIGDWSKDATGLETRIDFLNKSIALQTQRVEKLREQYEKQKAATGENSKAAQDWQIKLNNATAELNAMERELGQDKKALDDMKTSQDGAAKSTQTFSSVLGGLTAALKITLAVILLAITAVAGLAGGLSTLVFKSAESSAALNDLSLKTGITTERLQELAFVGDQVGTSQETIVSSLGKLTRSMSEAAKGTGETYDAFQQLGVSVTDSSGNLRDNEAVFADTIDALGRIKNESERDALAMRLFGKSAQELNPLIAAGGDEIARLSAEAHALGAVVDDDIRQSFAEFQDTVDGLKAGLSGTLTTLAAIFLPGFQQIFLQLTEYQKKFAGIVQGSNGDIGKIAAGLSKLVKTIAQDVADQAPALLKSGLDVVRTIGGAILLAVPELFPIAIELILQLVNFILQGLPGLIEAAIKLVITLAEGITDALPTLIPVITQAITTIVQTLLKNLPALVKAATGLMIALAQGLVAAIPILTKEIPAIVQALSDVLIELGPILLVAAAELVSVLVLGIVQNWPLMLAAAGQVLGTLFTFMWREITENVPAVGKALVEWFESGFKERWNTFVKSFSDNLAALWKLLSKLWGGGTDEAAKAGEARAKSLTEGFRRGLGDLNGDLGGAAASSASAFRGTQAGQAGQAAALPGESGGAGRAANLTINIYADGALSDTRFRQLSQSLAGIVSAQVLGEINDMMEPAT